jgi:pimeloyl-ACP methyl ester carboxylesterase
VPTGWRFIAPDLRGFGPSAASDDGGREAGNSCSVDTYARDLTWLLDALKIDEAIIGGLSMGGYITFALHRLSPERFSGMVLADTRPQADTPDGRAARAKMRDLLVEQGPTAIADAMLPRFFSARTKSQRPPFLAEMHRLMAATSPSAIDDALAALMDRPDSTGDLPHVSCPALVIVGELDEITPVADAEQMQREIPRSRLTIIPGAGHLSNVERPDEFSRALHDFLVAPM